MGLTIVDGPTILEGESLSDAADCSAGTIVRITVPQEFTDANLTFQASSDGSMYNDLYNDKEEEITLRAKADTTIVVSAPWTRTVAFIKIRSGTRANPVPQKVTTKLAVAVETPDTPPIAGDTARRG
jgi:hypothetical protein